jgi:hypothetical protein
LKHIKHAEIQPGSNLPPNIVGTQEIVPGNQLQGGVLAAPVAWQHTFSAPKKPAFASVSLLHRSSRPPVIVVATNANI